MKNMSGGGSFRPLFVLLGIVAAGVLPARTSVWKVTDGGRALYLGGTVHVLRTADFPLPREFDEAFAAAGLVCFETDIERAMSLEMQRVLAVHGMYKDGATADKVLAPGAWAAVEAWCGKNGLPAACLKPMKPWLLSFTLLAHALQKLDCAPDGVDAHFQKKARAAGKQSGMLETFGQQVEFLVRMGAGHENELILGTLEDLEKLPAMFDKIIAAWRAGDEKQLAAMLNDGLRKEHPAIHETLVVARNRAWLPVIEQWLSTPETEFVLVGAGHLCGDDGLLRALRDRGCAVEQIDAGQNGQN
ncbi:MAG: TraB/GumN family protein [Opitutaceae bacterium]|jgi:uncharacterized protein YbaP (TraB family)|nr:TraB/GumN family protein [Opitutaceae bacterium]